MKIVFMGTPRAAALSLERLVADGHEVTAVYTQPDRPSGRGNKITFSPVKEFALGRGIPVWQPPKIRSEEALQTFRSHQADVAVVVAYGRILPEGFLNAFPFGALNVHFSLLPKYRGAAPVNWAIVRGETETGVTTIQMNAGLDTGDILLQRATSIDEEETSIELMERISNLGAELISETLSKIHDLTPLPQNNDLATLAPMMKKQDGLIDWSLTAEEISRRVRGFQPFPSSFTYHNNCKLTLWRAHPAVEVEVREIEPGTVIEAKADRLLVACGNSTALATEEIQPEGKRRMAARDFVNGGKVRAGDIFDSDTIG